MSTGFTTRLLRLGLLVCLAASLGCAWSRPQAQELAAAEAVTPAVMDAGGLLSPQESQAAVEDAVAQARYRERAADLVKAVQAAAQAPLITSNQARLLNDGPQTYEAMFEAVRNARHHVNVETYIFDDGETGNRFADLLLERRRAGVTVRVIYDAIGSLMSEDEFFERLAAQGIEIAEFRPLESAAIWRINNRDHRKLVIVDGRVAYTGGINISETYSRGSSSRPGPEKGRDSGWRDTHVEVRGPVVKSLQSIFMETWRRLGKQAEPSTQLFPDVGPAGDDLVQVMASDGGDSNEYRIYDAYMAAIRAARERIWISQAYFAPDEALRKALIDAAGRGVDVRVIVPGFTDSSLVFHASRATYEELLQNKVRLFEYTEALLHSKTAVVDGIWSTVGSCNIDPRSFAHNNELNVAVVGRDFARTLEQTFRADLKHTKQIDPAKWAQRPVSEKMKEWFSSLFNYWL